VQELALIGLGVGAMVAGVLWPSDHQAWWKRSLWTMVPSLLFVLGVVWVLLGLAAGSGLLKA